MRKFGRAQWKEEPVTAFAAAAAPVISVLSGGLGILNALKGPKDVKMPSLPTLTSRTPDKLETPTAMPVADSDLTAEAKRKAVVAASQRGGRVSTFLSDSGGDSFGA